MPPNRQRNVAHSFRAELDGYAQSEHILGEHWPSVDVRMEMLDESVGLIRELWKGKLTNHFGPHVTVEGARIYTLPETLPPIAVAASGDKSAELAGRIGDAMVGTR